MGYVKVYLTIEEEEDIERLQEARRAAGRMGTAKNAILKQGLELVMSKELSPGGVLATKDPMDNAKLADAVGENSSAARMARRIARARRRAHRAQ